MKVTSRPTPDQETVGEHTLVQAEASRLLEFKKQNIRRQNQTPCPACAVFVHIDASKCPHCGSDISAHTALAREELSKLNEITQELYELHKKYGEHREREVSRRPLWDSPRLLKCSGRWRTSGRNLQRIPES